jgi:hypothetical protein
LRRGLLNFRIPRDIVRLFNSVVITVVVLLLALLLQLLHQRLVQDGALPLDAPLNVVRVHPLVLHLDLELHQLVLDFALLVVQRQLRPQLLAGPTPARQQRRQRVVRVVIVVVIILASSRGATVLLPVSSLLVTMPVMMIGTEGGPARLDVPRGGGPPHRAQADAVVHAAMELLMISRDGVGRRLVFIQSAVRYCIKRRNDDDDEGGAGNCWRLRDGDGGKVRRWKAHDGESRQHDRMREIERFDSWCVVVTT